MASVESGQGRHTNKHAQLLLIWLKSISENKHEQQLTSFRENN